MAEQGIILRKVGRFKNLRGVQRRLGNLAETPNGWYWYDGHHWQMFSVPQYIFDNRIKLAIKSGPIPEEWQEPFTVTLGNNAIVK